MKGYTGGVITSCTLTLLVLVIIGKNQEKIAIYKGDKLIKNAIAANLKKEKI